MFCCTLPNGELTGRVAVPPLDVCYHVAQSVLLAAAAMRGSVGLLVLLQCLGDKVQPVGILGVQFAAHFTHEAEGDLQVGGRLDHLRVTLPLLKILRPMQEPRMPAARVEGP